VCEPKSRIGRLLVDWRPLLLTMWMQTAGGRWYDGDGPHPVIRRPPDAQEDRSEEDADRREAQEAAGQCGAARPVRQGLRAAGARRRGARAQQVVLCPHGGRGADPARRGGVGQMTIDELRKARDKRPFVPFVIRMADGQSVTVRHPENLAWDEATGIAVCLSE